MEKKNSVFYSTCTPSIPYITYPEFSQGNAWHPRGHLIAIWISCLSDNPKRRHPTVTHAQSPCLPARVWNVFVWVLGTNPPSVNSSKKCFLYNFRRTRRNIFLPFARSQRHIMFDVRNNNLLSLPGKILLCYVIYWWKAKHCN